MRKIIVLLATIAVALSITAAPAAAVPPPNPVTFHYDGGYGGYIDDNCPDTYLEVVLFKNTIGTSGNTKVRLCTNLASAGWLPNNMDNAVTGIRILKYINPPGSYCRFRAYDYTGYTTGGAWDYDWYTPDGPTPWDFDPVVHNDRYSSFKWVCSS